MDMEKTKCKECGAIVSLDIAVISKNMCLTCWRAKQSEEHLSTRQGLIEFAGREVQQINLKVIFDNIRNYTLASFLLKAGYVQFSAGGIKTLFAVFSLSFAVVLVLTNMIQTYLILHRLFWESYKYTPGLMRSEHEGISDILYSFFAVLIGLIFVVTIFMAIPF